MEMVDQNVGSRLFDIAQIAPGGDWYFFDPAMGEGKTRDNLYRVTVFALLVESKVDAENQPFKCIVPLGVDDVADIGGLVGIEMEYFRGRELVHMSELGKIKFTDEPGFAED